MSDPVPSDDENPTPDLGAQVELVFDEDGVAVLGESSAVEAFLNSQGSLEESQDLSHRLGSLLRVVDPLLKASSEIVANSGRYLKLTEETAARLKEFGLTPTKVEGISYAMLGQPGDIKGWVQVLGDGPRKLLNPAALMSVSGLLSQLAAQQQIAEITAYLEGMDAKLDDVLKNQKNEQVAKLAGVADVVGRAFELWETTGSVTQHTWDSMQGVLVTLAEIQNFALLRLGDIATNLETEKNVGKLARAESRAEREVKEWLLVLAKTVQLQKEYDVIHLDRELQAGTEGIDQIRKTQELVRSERESRIAETANTLVARMDSAVVHAKEKLFFHPRRTPAIVDSSNVVVEQVSEFQEALELERVDMSWDQRSWKEAAIEKRDKYGPYALGAVGAVGTGAIRFLSKKK